MQSRPAQSLYELVFEDSSQKVYALLDGASIEGLLNKLNHHKPEFSCLYSGAIEPDLAQSAPYLVRLTADSSFAKWLLSDGLGKHWGIYLVSQDSLLDLRRHFRGLLMVRSPEGDTQYFRYYDPRVINVFLPTCTADEVGLMFGNIRAFWVEDVKKQSFCKYVRRGDRIACKRYATQFEER